MKTFFGKMAARASHALGHPFAFIAAVLLVLGWASLGPSLGYSENWQLVINTGTTIITFLSVFLIQNSQNRESLAMQLKLDEIVRAVKDARNKIIDLEDLPEEELEKLAEEFRRSAKDSEPEPEAATQKAKSKP